MLTGLSNDGLLLPIASFLTTPRDLLCLGLTCTLFITKCIAKPAVTRELPAAAVTGQTQEPRSIVEEAARRWLLQCSKQEQGWVPRRGQETVLGLMHEEVLLRHAAVLGRSHETIMLSEGGSRATGCQMDLHCRTAASKAIMRAGRHYAHFTVQGEMLCGLIRPGWDEREGQNAHLEDGHCFYYTYHGKRYPSSYGGEGMQSARQPGDRIGLLLDLDKGSMAVYKNDERLGVMESSGLRGAYCWAVSMFSQGRACAVACWDMKRRAI